MNLINAVIACAFAVSSVLATDSYKIPAQCKGEVRVRVEWHDLTKAQRDTYVKAIHCVYQSGEYAKKIEQHVAGMSKWHNGALFLPAHRDYLVELENLMRKCEPNVIFAYWDTSLDAAKPSSSVVWDHFGKTKAGDCVSTAPFNQWSYNEHKCITRGFSYGGQLSALDDPATVSALIKQDGDYATFTNSLEVGIHLRVHSVLGGNGGTMSYGYAPLDPVFVLHHTNIDRIWADWSNEDPSHRLLQFGGRQNGQPCTHDTPIPSNTGRKVKDVLNTLDLCYVYVTPRSKLPFIIGDDKKPSAPGNYTMPPKPLPIPEESCKKLGYDKKEVEKCEKDLSDIYDDCKNVGPEKYIYYGKDAHVDLGENCTIAAKVIAEVIPSYGKTDGYSYGSGDYISTESSKSGATSIAGNLVSAFAIAAIIIAA